MIVGTHSTHPFQMQSTSEMYHIKAQYISSVDGSAIPGDLNNAMKTHLQNCAELLTEATMPAPGATKLNLIPLSNHMTTLATANKVSINEIQIIPISIQSLSTDVNTALEASLGSPTAPFMAYNMAQGRFTVPPSWFPNFFNPIITVNGVQLYRNGAQSSVSIYSATNHKGALSTGLHFPYQDIIQKTWSTPITSITINAGAFQIIELAGVDKFQRYPLYCEIDFTVEA